MKNLGIKSPQASLVDYGISQMKNAFWNLTAEELTEHCITKNLGVLSDSGAITINTGNFTGRSPKDRFIVKDSFTENSVDWSPINLPFSSNRFDLLADKVREHLGNQELYIHDGYVCADEDYSMNVRLVAELAWSAHFARNMFLRLSEEKIKAFSPDWTILCAPSFMADPEVDGTRQSNFAILNFTKKMILIGGTGYTGEIKKGIFSALNFLLPYTKDVLSMHCSSNIGDDGTAVFFGLSGTGKTTLSADPDRALIGDDEHGWSQNGVFNFEGGCYAKVIDLSEDKEPDIFRAIKHGAILENVVFKKGTRTPDYEDVSITQNTRVSYPIDHIDNAAKGSKGGHPKNIFFLTADAFGVLPPISKLTNGQAMYQFISGYTAKVAGTEEGVVEPEATFSSCFGAPFLPLHPTYYAKMLGEKIEKYKVNVWLINTGWTGGEYGVGDRISLKYTRAMITAALAGKLDNVMFEKHPIFGLYMPTTCPNVPSNVLNPRKTWENKTAYDKKANLLAKYFNDNFKKFEDKATAEILAAAPKVLATVK